MEDNFGRNLLNSDNFTSQFYDSLLSGTSLKTCREKVYVKNKKMNGMGSRKGVEESRKVDTIKDVIGEIFREDFFPQIQTLNKGKTTQKSRWIGLTEEKRTRL